MMRETDFLVVGAGIAGAGIAYNLSLTSRVVMVDMEELAGYHTTGRSAAFYAETYGGPKIQPLTSASKDFHLNPPAQVSGHPILRKLGAVHIFREEQRNRAEAMYGELSGQLSGVRFVSPSEIKQQAPYLKPEAVAGGIADPDCGDLDVAALHHGFLSAAKKQGAELLLEAPFRAARREGDFWVVETGQGEIKARVIVNAAGAWGDEVARLAGVKPIGLSPLRRTIVTISNPKGLPFNRMGPVVFDVEGAFYFKPEGEGYLLTPADEVPSPACDIQPELEDIAVAVDCFERATGAAVETIDAKWAGLRTFAPDRTPVIGFDAKVPGFFWNVGQGGYGIQTAPAWSELASALAMGQSTPEYLKKFGVKAGHYDPARF